MFYLCRRCLSTTLAFRGERVVDRTWARSGNEGSGLTVLDLQLKSAVLCPQQQKLLKKIKNRNDVLERIKLNILMQSKSKLMLFKVKLRLLSPFFVNYNKIILKDWPMVLMTSEGNKIKSVRYLSPHCFLLKKVQLFGTQNYSRDLNTQLVWNSKGWK